MQKFPRVSSSRTVISSQFVSETDFLAEVLRLEAISRFPTGGVLLPTTPVALSGRR